MRENKGAKKKKRGKCFPLPRVFSKREKKERGVW
jgi:hypothetical protein